MRQLQKVTLDGKDYELEITSGKTTAKAERIGLQVYLNNKMYHGWVWVPKSLRSNLEWIIKNKFKELEEYREKSLEEITREIEEIEYYHSSDVPGLTPFPSHAGDEEG